MGRDHDEYICKALLADEALHSELRIWADFLLVVPLTVAYSLQYRYSLKTPGKPLPRSYVVCAALFALFQLCDHHLDDSYGVLVEAHCSEWYSNTKATFDVWMMSWILGFQCVAATVLMVIYTIRSWREIPIEQDDDLNGGGGQAPDEETPLLRPRSPQPTHRFMQTGSRADLNPNLNWNAIPAPIRYCIATIIVLLVTMNLFLFALVISTGAVTALIITCLVVLVLLLPLGCFPLIKKQTSQHRHPPESQPELPEETMGEGETAPLLPTAGTAVLDARQSGHCISWINSYPNWSVTIKLSSLLSWLVTATIAIVPIFYVFVSLYYGDRVPIFHLVSLIGMLFLVILAFLPEAQTKKVEHRCNLLCAGLLIAIGVMVLNIYIDPIWWDSSRWRVPMEFDMWVAIFRSASLVFSWLFFILQFIPLIRRAWKRQDNGLSLWFLVIRVTTQTLILASLVERADKRFRVEKQWCADDYWERFPTCGPPFYKDARREHVWEVPLFWVLSMQARMGYAVVVLVVVATCAWWRGRNQSEEMRGEEDNDEERAVVGQGE